jgi:hypothetical protein
MSESDNARRTIEKAEEVLQVCHKFFHHQAQMNAASHLSGRVMYPPICASIESVLQGISTFKETYPGDS